MKNSSKFICSFVILLLVIGTLWYVPKFQVSQLHINNNTTNTNDYFKKAELEDKFRSILAQIIGGLAVFVGLYFTWKRNEAAEKSLLITQEGQITERFTRAIEHLGKKQMELKLGGIYALERIASESERDHWPIMEILTSYIRMNSSNTLEKIDHKINGQIELDIQAILNVFRRRNMKYCEVGIFDLNNTYLANAKLVMICFYMATILFILKRHI